MPRLLRQNTTGSTIRSSNIPVVLPDAVQNEEELDKDAAKRKNATHHNSRYRFSEERLLWNLPGNLICSHWLLNGLHSGQEQEKKEYNAYPIAAKNKGVK